MAKIEDIELASYRSEIAGDVKVLVEKYRKIFDWDVPDIDQRAADGLILAEVALAVDAIRKDLLG
jgi:hypothetical protein